MPAVLLGLGSNSTGNGAIDFSELYCFLYYHNIYFLNHSYIKFMFIVSFLCLNLVLLLTFTSDKCGWSVYVGKEKCYIRLIVFVSF